MNTIDKISLKLPTNRVVNGPKLNFRPDSLVVEYDYEMDDGTHKWTKVLFEDILAFEWRNNCCFKAEDVLNSQVMRFKKKSKYLDSILKVWQALIGWHEYQIKLGGKDRFKHFTMYFDDAGTINVVAANCIVEEIDQ
jgi:hypothetical protein